ncbi:MAG TPA: tetratricopeptide repeat protein [Terriglobales bacterium]|nr:tetratricopeptide repeat protein [Terriglobales bacterium]
MDKSSQKARSGPWIYNPWVDETVGCGGWSAPLLLLTYVASSSHAIAWSIGFYALALFFNYPHYMATLYRAYHTREDFAKYRIFTLHITLLIASTLVLLHAFPRLLPWVFTLYLTWSPWHYSGQNFGLFMMFARRAGAQPSSGERRALYWAFVASYLFLFLGFHTGHSIDPLFVSLNIPAPVSHWTQLLLGTCFLLLSGFGMQGLSKRSGWRPLIPSLTLLSTQFAWFLLPTILSLVKGWQIPQSRYSTGVLALMHSAQYLWITSYYARREAKTNESGSKPSAWQPLRYFGLMIVGGIALFIPGPWVASYFFHVDFGTSVLIFSAIVNLHHFILDGAIWKLRDGRIGSLLLNSQERIKAGAEAASLGFGRGARWLAGATLQARALRVSLALVLVAWAVLDQARYLEAVGDRTLAGLHRAAAMNSADAALQMRIASKELELGDGKSAVEAWKRAIAIAPANPAPRNALLHYLTEEGRYQEAYELTGQWAAKNPRDSDLLVNHGVLAKELGHADEAFASWRRALSANPSQLAAHLYLADELESRGQAQEAIPHYVIYLEKIAQQGAEQLPPADKVAPILFRLAKCQQLAGREEQAAKSYELAATIAGRSGQARLQSVALAGEADLRARQGKAEQALHLYQQTLKLDASAGDPKGEAVDWYNYALFLREHNRPARLVYACLMKSRSLLKSPQDSTELQIVNRDIKELARRIPREALETERDPEAAIQQALAVTM